MRKLVLGLVMAASLLIAGSARANYVCSYQYVPLTSSSAGNFGYIWSNYFTGPHCSGNFVNTLFFCSTGAASNTNCATAATCGGTQSYLYSEAGLHSLAEMLQQSEIYGKSLTTSFCGTNAGTWVIFSE